MLQALAFDVGCLMTTGIEAMEMVESCCGENNVTLESMANVFEKKCPRQHKCALTCIMEAVSLIQDGKIATDFLINVAQMVPVQLVKKICIPLLTKCKAAGNGEDRCENSHRWYKCMTTKFLATALRAFTG
ncbi:hypothetical protein C0J52_00269 [Blattella germanica]|nr:hypothetical protein C0J52_00269 [Blattella germanica]